MEGDDAELRYYRSVEDLFASLRGAPHILSPRDFQLLRSWWSDDVPLAAVSAGLTEVFARNRERDGADPVVSLSYCRHAVKRHAKRLAAMHLGESGSGAEVEPEGEDQEDWRRLVEELTAAAESQRNQRPAVAKVLAGIADQIQIAGRDLPLDLLDEHVYSLESTMLEECRLALPSVEQREIDARVDAAVEATSATDEARRRSARALRDREIRLLLGLPRLELGR
jgi:hypothetical protein